MDFPQHTCGQGKLQEPACDTGCQPLRALLVLLDWLVECWKLLSNCDSCGALVVFQVHSDGEQSFR